MNKSFLERAIDNGAFDLLDRNGRFVNSQDTCSFARRRTDTSRELRKIIRGMELPNRVFPSPVVHKIIPVRDDIV